MSVMNSLKPQIWWFGKYSSFIPRLQLLPLLIVVEDDLQLIIFSKGDGTVIPLTDAEALLIVFCPVEENLSTLMPEVWELMETALVSISFDKLVLM